MNQVVAGATAGIVTTVMMHPLDVVKIRMQVGRHSSILAALRSLKSPSDAYRGIIPNLLGNGIAWGAYYWIYESLQSLSYGVGLPKNDPRTYWLCSFTAGLLTQLSTNPIWVLKTRILGTSRAERSGSLVVAFRELLREDGFKGLWRGFVPGIFGTVQSSIYFTIYDTAKPHMTALPQWSRTSSASALAKIISISLMYPHQVLRSQMQFKSMGLTAACKQIYRERGLYGFYSGISANLTRMVPSMIVNAITYDFIRQRI